MNSIVRILMTDQDGPFLQLKDLLFLIPDNTLLWTILDFYGVGLPPGNLTMDQFEELVKSRPTGYLMSWTELKDFASGLEQTFDCFVVGASAIDCFIQDEIGIEHFVDCDYVVEAFDGSEWSISVKDPRIQQVFASLTTKNNAKR